MGSLVLATNPERRIVRASAEVAESVGSAPRFMQGVDCACILRCRNADGEPLCDGMCPALMAARRKRGEAVVVPVWLEKPNGELRPFDATFQRVESMPPGMVVALFRETEGVEAPAAAAPEEQAAIHQQEPRPTRAAIPRRVRRRPVALVPRAERRRPRLKLVSG